MRLEVGVHAIQKTRSERMFHRWQRLSPRVITGINRAGQRRFSRGRDERKDPTGSGPPTSSATPPPPPFPYSSDRAAAHQIPIMTAASLKTKLSRWENGHEAVGLPEYRRLFREIYGRTDAELGFPTDNGTPRPADELRARLAAARTVDPATITAFRAQIDATRRLDRQFGGLTQLDQLRGHIDHVTGLLTHGPAAGHRAALAAALTEASTLAGWQALDRDDHAAGLGALRARQTRRPRSRITATARARHRRTSLRPHRSRRARRPPPSRPSTPATSPTPARRCYERGSPPPTAKPSPPPATATPRCAPSTTPHALLPADPVGPGAAVPVPRRRPPRPLARQRPGPARRPRRDRPPHPRPRPATGRLDPRPRRAPGRPRLRPLPPPATATPRSPMPAPRAGSPSRSTPTGNYAGSPVSSCPPTAAPREAR